MEKLRPEQRKLWRRIYLRNHEDGCNSAICSQRADEAVKDWEERGAFDVESSDESDPKPEYIHLRGKMPQAWQKICDKRADKHFFVAFCGTDECFTLVARTTIGARLLRIVVERGFEPMLSSVVDHLETPKIEPMDPLTP